MLICKIKRVSLKKTQFLPHFADDINHNYDSFFDRQIQQRAGHGVSQKSTEKHYAQFLFNSARSRSRHYLILFYGVSPSSSPLIDSYFVSLCFLSVYLVSAKVSDPCLLFRSSVKQSRFHGQHCTEAEPEKQTLRHNDGQHLFAWRNCGSVLYGTHGDHNAFI